MTKRSYGLLIKESTRHSLHRVIAEIVVREDGAESPINPRSDGEDSIWDAPKHLDGLMLSGFGIHGFVSDLEGFPYCGCEPEFRDIYSADSRDVARMAATFKRVNRQLAKDSPREPGDLFVSLAHALKLDFAVWRVANGVERSQYSENAWNWRTINEGRNHFRHLIDTARQAAAAAKRAA